MKKKLILGMLTAGLLLAGCSSGQTASIETVPAQSGTEAEENGNSEESAESEEEVAPFIFTSFETEDLDGNAVDETLFSKADINMVNIWATFCNPCIREMPELGELAAEFEAEWETAGEDDLTVQIVGICSDITDNEGNLIDGQLEQAQSIVEQTGAAYTHIVPDKEIYDGFLSMIYSVPTTIFLDSEGNLLAQPVSGALDKENWQNVISQVKDIVREKNQTEA